MDCMEEALNGRKLIKKELPVRDPFKREGRITAKYLIDEEDSTAYVEVANSAGLQNLSVEERDPEKACSIGTGELFSHCY